MADNAEGTADAQVTFKVKTGQDSNHTITMSESASVLDLKTKLAGEDFENVPVERQRLIYSGRVMKNDDTLATYKIKPNNTIHMVKSAASNPAPQPAASASTPTAPAVPSNMAAGTANNILAGLTGARYAGHINLPSRETFGADGGMGAPPSDDQLAQMLSDPSMLQTMNAALDNPDFINYMIQSNPHLRNVPNAREIIQSPFMRQMMTNPDMLRNVMRMQRNDMGFFDFDRNVAALRRSGGSVQGAIEHLLSG
ncbi:ubiquitin-related domain-containing protein [Colletotrichum godetiae]|uniref:Ubiquitin-related domain-containing protein n=1 Tax=Colletotrichum godetiae TaxID=1209918 RepID=A0AAJ0AV15_9PEZI|nr:ubiquitin-related domain-containing protein [Colletotrichum godetiae]KAK1690308.1 ubiquitin-related domain-containing protein [Colletotrichum godetiae]